LRLVRNIIRCGASISAGGVFIVRISLCRQYVFQTLSRPADVLRQGARNTREKNV
jgi:hypothetical protein